MSERTGDEDFPLPDLSGTTLERIARLCGPAAGLLDPDDLADRPALRRAVLRVQREEEHTGELYAGFASCLPRLKAGDEPLPEEQAGELYAGFASHLL